MKKLILSLFLFAALVVPAYASTLGDKTQVGAKLDAPNLVKLNDSWSIGTELNKDVRHTNADEGWAVWAKVTYSGSLFDLSKKESK